MKKITMFFLAVLALTFIACGKEEGGLADKIKSLDKTEATSDSVDHGDKGEYLDIDRIVSEFDINEEDDEHIEFQDRDQEREVYRIFIFEKMNSLDFNNPNRIDILENFYIEKNCEIIYKDDKTIIIGLEQDNSFAYNIHYFDNTKTELSAIVSIGSQKKLSEDELLNILDEAKAFIRK
ncbi:hypothetical protein [Fusobacterium periodonticum]|jgi:hypothetical protein|uniref:DUF4367 domain-containing protein n=1 Tax=Fusobacterium periodonticum ATCC 33693 TaxID=546275 RepID=D4CS02_9FUSO|nr:hypothetical protein [Fusobacterium periodonticum]EFE87869.1 hypothetical protein FUSPEROL_00160 [Fusobacterium periodonticum ATCC 33693]